MKKESKNVNINFDLDTGFWNVRNNGEIIAQGRGLDSVSEFQRDNKFDKPMKMHWRG